MRSSNCHCKHFMAEIIMAYMTVTMINAHLLALDSLVELITVTVSLCAITTQLQLEEMFIISSIVTEQTFNC